MKVGGATAVAQRPAAPVRATSDKKERVKRGEGVAKVFSAEVTFTGRENGQRFTNTHPGVEVKASTVFGAVGRAVRNAMPLERKNHKGKCKWFRVEVAVEPADE